MSWSSRSRMAFGSFAAAVLALSACAPAGLQTGSEAPAGSPAPASSASTNAEPATTPETPGDSSSPDANPSAAYTGDPNSLIPGKNHIGSAAPYVYSSKLVQQWLKGEVKPTKKIVFLTFDDGPNHSTTPVILKALKDANVHATFFVVGSMLGEAPELLKAEVEQGNSIGLHSWSHDYKQLYPGRKGNTKQIIKEYDRTLAKVRETLGSDFNTESWRYPGGHMSWKNLGEADAHLAKQGVSWIDWNADTQDSAPKSTRPKTVEALVHNATAPIRDGYHVSVILGHDTPDKKITSESVSAIIKEYKNAGFEFGVMS